MDGLLFLLFNLLCNFLACNIKNISIGLWCPITIIPFCSVSLLVFTRYLLSVSTQADDVLFNHEH